MSQPYTYGVLMHPKTESHGRCQSEHMSNIRAKLVMPCLGATVIADTPLITCKYTRPGPQDNTYMSLGRTCPHRRGYFGIPVRWASSLRVGHRRYRPQEDVSLGRHLQGGLILAWLGYQGLVEPVPG